MNSPMLQFFHGWRRKAGGAALVMACVLMGMWIRSLAFGDLFSFGQSGRGYHFPASFQGGLKWITSNDPLHSLNPPRYVFSATERYASDETLMPVFGGDSTDWRWHRHGVGFHFGTGTVSGFQVTVGVIPYWFVTIPLTLLSAYLLLVPSRKYPPTASPSHPRILSRLEEKSRLRHADDGVSTDGNVVPQLP